MKLKFILLLEILFFLSCKTYKKIDLIGIYKGKSSQLTSSKLILNRNNSFEYKYQAGDIYKIDTKGSWHISPDHKFLILTSDIRSDSDLIKVSEIEIDSQNKIKVCVYDEKNNPYTAYIKLNRDSRMFLASDRVFNCKYFPMQNVNEIAVTYLGLKAKNNIVYYKVKNLNANNFIIHINISSPDFYRYFISEKWKIKRNKLYDLDTIYNKNAKVYYKQ